MARTWKEFEEEEAKAGPEWREFVEHVRRLQSQKMKPDDIVRDVRANPKFARVHDRLSRFVIHYAPMPPPVT